MPLSPASHNSNGRKEGKKVKIQIQYYDSNPYFGDQSGQNSDG